jgi:hypothetical protein
MINREMKTGKKTTMTNEIKRMMTIDQESDGMMVDDDEEGNGTVLPLFLPPKFFSPNHLG